VELLRDITGTMEDLSPVAAILEGISDGLVAFDWELNFIYLNRVAEQIAGKCRKELLGKFLWDVFPELVDTPLYNNYLKAINEHVTVEFEGLLSTSGRWYLIRVLPSLQGVAVYFKDIHERKLIELALRKSEQHYRRAAEEAEAANKAKDQFLAVLSHELRTPLMPVLATAVSLIHDSRLPLPLLEEVRTMQRNVQLEGRLIDDLLDVTRIANGKLNLRIETVRLDKTVIRAMEICRSEITDKDIKLTFQLYPKKKCVRGDPLRIQQILWNLLHNAIKFTPKGGNISIVIANKPGDLTSVSISDDGIGIDPNMLGRIFERFVQTDAADAGHFGGLGLGLAITKALVEAQGGTITAQSKGAGQGAAFTFTLPTSDGTDDACEPDEAEHLSERKKLRILLVEDHQDTVRVMSKVLASWGHTVLAASDVKSALQLAAATEFDLLISDLGLPDGTGMELMQTLHNKSPIKAIALSGSGMENDIQNCLNAGFAHHLTKPINLEALNRLIQRLA
jgi:PAS domain S-box-containing protein